MSEMVKRVALVLCKSDGDCRCASSGGTSSICHVAEFNDAARAAIKAMREPTEAMLRADMHLGGYDGLFEAEPDEIWRAMIDAALKP